MTTWKSGGRYGTLRREVVSEDGNVCVVRMERWGDGPKPEPWPEGEANFRLILQAPKMLEALEAIQDKAERMLQDYTIPWTGADWLLVKEKASAAIAAVKGEDDDGR